MTVARRLLRRWRRGSGIVHVTRRDGSYIVAGFSRTDTGPHVLNDWVRRTPDSLPDDDLGAVVLAGMAASARVERYVPSNEPEMAAPEMQGLLKVAGVRSYKQLTTGAVLAVVSRVDGLLVASAWRNVGRGFDPAAFSVSADPGDPAAIGRAVRDALGYAS